MKHEFDQPPVMSKSKKIILFGSAPLGAFCAAVRVAYGEPAHILAYVVILFTVIIQALMSAWCAMEAYKLLRAGCAPPDDGEPNLPYCAHMAVYIHLHTEGDATLAIAKSAIFYSLLNDVLVLFLIGAVIIDISAR